MNSEETFLLNKIHFKDFDINFRFHNETTVYFISNLTKKLDEEFGDLSARITDIENTLFRQLANFILQYENDLIAINNFLKQSELRGDKIILV